MSQKKHVCCLECLKKGNTDPTMAYANDTTIERKMFLVLNKQHWRPLKDVPDDDPYYHELCVAAGLRHDKPKEGEPAASAPPPPLATPLDATAYLDSDDDDE